MTLAGLFTGLIGAFLLSLSRLLYGVSAADPLSFVVVPIRLAAVAVTACVVPARRAASVDPLQVLRR